jgi:hypothetical protein
MKAPAVIIPGATKPGPEESVPVHAEILDWEGEQPEVVANDGNAAEVPMMLPNGRRGTQADMLEYLRAPRAAQHVHSDGFLSLSAMPVAYVCSRCGFRGVFSRRRCIRCESLVLPVNAKTGKELVDG